MPIDDLLAVQRAHTESGRAAAILEIRRRWPSISVTALSATFERIIAATVTVPPQIVGSNALICHPNGGNVFGTVPGGMPHNIPGGNIYLKYGEHRGPNRGFGLHHIWRSHRSDLIKRGYVFEDDAARYVADIIRVGAPIYSEGDSIRRERLSVIRSNIGIAIIEHRPIRKKDLAYSVITAFPRFQPHGTLVGQIEKAP